MDTLAKQALAVLTQLILTEIIPWMEKQITGDFKLGNVCGRCVVCLCEQKAKLPATADQMGDDAVCTLIDQHRKH